MKTFPLNIKISGQLTNVLKNFSKVEKGLQNISNAASGLGAKMSVGVTAPLLTLGGLSLRAADKFENMGVALETAFQGNVEAAKAAQQQIVDFTAKTPFQLEEVMDSFLKLKNMGLDPSEEALTSYGNTAGAMGKSLNQMIEAVADAATGEFERLKEFGIKAKSEGDNVTFNFRGQNTTIKKNSEEIQRYLLELGNTDFAGGMIKQGQTLSGVFSSLRDSIFTALGRVGESVSNVTGLKDRMKSLTEVVNGLADRFTKLSPRTQEILVWAGLAVAAMGPVLMVFGQLGFAIIGISHAITALMPVLAALGAALAFLAKNPLFLMISAIVFAAVKFQELVKVAGSTGEAIKAIFLGLGSYVFDYFLNPLQKGLSKILDGIESIGIKAPKSLRAIADFDYEMFAENALRQDVNVSNSAGRSRLDVNFNNAPPGMRVNQGSNDGLDMLMNVGYQMGRP